jgi:formylglycine-generating enzyme required for sulfatase activity
MERINRILSKNTNSFFYLFLSLYIPVLLVACESKTQILNPAHFPTSLQETSRPALTMTGTIPVRSTQTATAAASGTSTIWIEPSITISPTLISGASKIALKDQMTMRYVPAGEFLMGSQDSDESADEDEKPQRLVFLSAIWIDQTVVTNEMYARFLNEMGNQIENRVTWLDAADEDVLIYLLDSKWQPLAGYENHPVVEVTWYGARAYCLWAGRKLPTEAEWEKAARGPISGSEPNRIYPWGDQIDCEHAQYANCSGTLLEANSKPAGASPYQVLGLSGNTWEWVADWYAANAYSSLPTDDPSGPEMGATKVLRGGSWEYDWKHLRLANRRHNGPGTSNHDYSFRCVQPSVNTFRK